MLDADEAATTALQRLASSGHSRAPVGVHGALDDVIGVVHLRDLLAGGDRPVRDVVSELCALPEAAAVLDALHVLQARRTQMAMVVDEHGGVSGIVTVEDLVEELVGEIYDESDRDVATVQRQPDGALVLPGSFPVHDLIDLGIDVELDSSYATVAGLVLAHLGRLPDAPGDAVTVGTWRIEVIGVAAHAVTEVKIQPTVEPTPIFGVHGKVTGPGWPW